MLTAEKISKKIGTKTILHNIDLHIGAGEFITVFGPNGAGKSTLLNILAMLMKPTTGNLLINGVNTREESAGARKMIGVISHRTFLYDNLTAYENLEFYGRMYGVADLRTRIHEALQEVGLEFFLNDPVRIFSRGMQQRLAIARAVLHQPALLFLDEPYTGLDQQATEILRGVLAGLNVSGRTVFMITHNFEQGLDLSHRTILLMKGRIAFEGKSGDLSPERMKEIYMEIVGGRAS